MEPIVVPEARPIATNPSRLIEAIVRSRIADSLYWKEACFGLNAETLLDKAVDLVSIGGQYGNQKATEFMCLTYKLLLLQPDFNIILFYIEQEEFKYLRALGAFYLRLIGRPVDVYKYIEPLLNDRRKLRLRTAGGFMLVHMDEFADSLLREERVCDTLLPRLPKRSVLEETRELEPRISLLDDELMEEEEEELEEEELEEEEEKDERSRSISRERSRDRRRDASRSRSRERSRGRRKDASRSRSRSRQRRYRSRSRDRRSRSRSRQRRYRSRSRDRRSRSRSRDSYTRKSRRHSRSRSRDDYARNKSDVRSTSRDRYEDKKSKSYSKKKVQGLFKKDSAAAPSYKESSFSSSKGGAGAGEELSIEETNKIRISLGLKPLKL